MRLALTGGIGCGKSTVRQQLADYGFVTLDSDKLVHEILQHDREVSGAIGEHFGKKVLKPDGGVDRKVLGEVIFFDTKALSWLEALLHPRVRKAWLSRLDAEPETHWLVEIPLLFENKLEKHFDNSVCITTCQLTQIKRLARRGLSSEQAQQRIMRQMPISEKCDLADYVLLNDGSLAFLKAQTDMLIRMLASA